GDSGQVATVVALQPPARSEYRASTFAPDDVYPTTEEAIAASMAQARRLVDQSYDNPWTGSPGSPGSPAPGEPARKIPRLTSHPRRPPRSRARARAAEVVPVAPAAPPAPPAYRARPLAAHADDQACEGALAAPGAPAGGLVVQGPENWGTGSPGSPGAGDPGD